MPLATRLLLAVVLVGGAPAWVRAQTAASPWQIINVDGRHYLSLHQIAAFYGFPRPPEINAAYASLNSPQRVVSFAMQSQEMRIDGVSHWLSFPVRQRDGRVLISRMDLAKTIEPILRPTRIKGAEPFRTIVIDAGHGGSDSGARSQFTLDEKKLTLDIALRLQALCRARNFTTVMTRSSDEFIPLETRANFADVTPSSIFVSIHCNYGNPEASGIETYCLSPRGAPSTNNRGHMSLTDYSHTEGEFSDAPSLLLAHCVQRRLGWLRQATEERRGVKRARFAVLRKTVRPSILVEAGFVTNPEDARLLSDPAHRQLVAQQILSGIVDYRSLILTGRSPSSAPVVAETPRRPPAISPALAFTTNSTASRAPASNPALDGLVAEWSQRTGASNGLPVMPAATNTPAASP
jgi:N-acetylmuramoyl-L-alanine amidase